MESLIEKLYHHNVIFSYYGFIDEGVLSEVLRITRAKLATNGEPPALIDRVHHAIKDCIDNIIHHNFYPDDERVHYKSLIVVSHQADYYLIHTLNVVNETQKSVIDEQLRLLESKSRDELKTLRSNGVLNNTDAVNQRLVDLVLKSDNCDCTFRPLNENFLFNINFKISPVAEPVTSVNA
jgi:hypothetical protein